MKTDFEKKFKDKRDAFDSRFKRQVKLTIALGVFWFLIVAGLTAFGIFVVVKTMIHFGIL